MGDAARFYTLLRWFASIGVCWLCSMDFAIATVEHESGRQWKDETGRKCEHKDRHGRACRSIGELHWAERPQRSEVKGAA